MSTGLYFLLLEDRCGKNGVLLDKENRRKCMGRRCKIPVIPNGAVVGKWNSTYVHHGDVIKYKCNSGPRLHEYSTSLCYYGSWLPTAKCLQSDKVFGVRLAEVISPRFTENDPKTIKGYSDITLTQSLTRVTFGSSTHAVNTTTATLRTNESYSDASTNWYGVLVTGVFVIWSVWVLVGLAMLVYRWSRKQDNRTTTARRPSDGAESEYHMYTDIESLRYEHVSERTDRDSRVMSHIPLPSRKRGHFDVLAARLQKFVSVRNPFNSQSSFDNRNVEMGIQMTGKAHEHPERNEKGDLKYEWLEIEKNDSKTSEQPQLESDFQTVQPLTFSVDLRNSRYDALIKSEDGRDSGPYDTLNRAELNTGEASSRHDYCTLENIKFPTDEGCSVYHVSNYIGTIEHDVRNMEIIHESGTESDGKPVLELDKFSVDEDSPIYHGDSEMGTVDDVGKMEIKKVTDTENDNPNKRGNSSLNKLQDGHTPGTKDFKSQKTVKNEEADSIEYVDFIDGTEPTNKTGLTKNRPNYGTANCDMITSDVHKAYTTHYGTNKGTRNKDYIICTSMNSQITIEDEDYEVFKLGEAPVPPGETEKEEEGEMDNGYLKPVKCKTNVYVELSNVGSGTTVNPHM